MELSQQQRSNEHTQNEDAARNRFEILRKNSLATIRETYGSIRGTAANAERIVTEIVEMYSSELDTYVANVDEMLNDIRDGKRSNFADADLERIVMRLPIIMYRVGDLIDRAAIESDVSKATLTSMQAENYLNAPGKTIPEKRSYADIQTMNEAVVVDLSRHVYQRLKNKLEHATMLFDSVRKVMSAHDTEKSTFGRTR